MPKTVMKVYLRMTVMIILAHVTGSLVLLGNIWGALTSVLGCLYQMCNVLIFAADEPVRLSKKMAEAMLRMAAMVILGFAAGYTAIGGLLGIAIPLIAVSLYQTVKMVIFVYRHGTSSK